MQAKLFIDREKELDLLFKLVLNNEKILIKGRRGIGKSLLTFKVYEMVKKKGFNAIWIDCPLISSSRDLLKFLKSELGFDFETSKDERSNIQFFFQNLNGKIKLLVLDELTYLFETFGRKKEFGNISNFLSFLRSLLMRANFSVIATVSKTSELRKAVKKARLFGRTFSFVIKLRPFDMESSILLVKELGKMFNLEIKNPEKIAIYGDFVPFYIESITKSYMLYKDADKALISEFEGGTLSEYFMSLVEDLNPTQKAIIYQLAQGRKKYEELERAIGDRDLAQSLEELLEMDLVEKIYISRKNVFYSAKDRTFASWLLYWASPALRRDIELFKKYSSIGFEALVRETLGSLEREIIVKDAIGRELKLGPFRFIGTHRDKFGQIDVYGVDFSSRILLGECYFGRNPPVEKINQLLKFDEIFQNNVKALFYISNESEELIKLAKEKNVYLVPLDVLKHIRKHTKLHPF